MNAFQLRELQEIQRTVDVLVRRELQQIQTKLNTMEQKITVRMEQYSTTKFIPTPNSLLILYFPRIWNFKASKYTIEHRIWTAPTPVLQAAEGHHVKARPGLEPEDRREADHVDGAEAGNDQATMSISTDLTHRH